MKNTTLAVSIVATLAGLGMSSIASGAIVVINSRATWDAYVAFHGATVATEDFESFLKRREEKCKNWWAS